ncbi:MAG: DUF3570 domain-containing protein, partial [Burkholderiaceae bacterium]
MAATELRAKQQGAWRRVLKALFAWRHAASAPLAGLLGGVIAPHVVHAADLPEDSADAMIHVYDGGGVRAIGPALLVRKKLLDKVSLSATYYIDSVSNASIDVVTTASPYKENRSEYGFSADYAVRDSTMTLALTSSKEPDYTADNMSIDVSQEVFGGMSTVSLGYTRGSDKVGKKGIGFFDTATHWKYRLGLTQILTPTWIASANFEALSDDGYLGSPYRVARVFGATVPERNPRTRTGRAMKFRVIGDLGSRNAVRAEYRYYWDTWAIKAHTVEFGYSRYFGDAWLADVSLRYNTQKRALFYSDNAATETLYVSRNRQLGTYNSIGLGGKLSYSMGKVQGKYEVKLNGSYERVRFKYSDFTDVRTGK